MKKTIFVGFAALAVILAFGQSSTGTATHGSSADSINAAAEQRMRDQQDQWFKDGEFPKDIQSLKTLYELHPDDYTIATDLGWMLENIEHWGQALGIYLEYKQKNPSNPDATFPEANFYFRRKLYSKVPAVLEPSIAASKPHPGPNTYRLLAHAYDKLGLLKDSIRVWNTYLAFAPQDRAAIHNRDEVEKRLTTTR